MFVTMLINQKQCSTLQLIRKQLDDEIITIGVGDNENDIDMIKNTDYPCLVKNENFDSSLII